MIIIIIHPSSSSGNMKIVIYFYADKILYSARLEISKTVIGYQLSNSSICMRLRDAVYQEHEAKT